MAVFSLPTGSERERRTAWTAFAFLLLLMVSHSMMETVRDALFLGSLPAERLPYVYLVIVVASVLVTRRLSPLLARLRLNVALTRWLLLSAGITVGFWAFIDQLGQFGLYALYVWSALVTTIALVQFWTLLGDVLAFKSAKQVYAFIGAGSGVGAIIGSAVAAGVTNVVGARHALLVAAGVLVSCTIGPILLARWNDLDGADATPPSAPEKFRDMAGKSLSNSYTRQVVLLIALMAVTTTLGDYVFKSAMADAVPADELGVYFGAAYFVFNVAGLFVQLALVNSILQRFTLTGALVILPVLILMGGTGFLIGGGVIAATALRGADGALRHSLQRTALELLYVPLEHTRRQRLKLFNDLFAQRGAQAFASILILGIAAFELPLLAVAVLLCTSAAGWVIVAWLTQRPYLDLFRSRLDPEQIDLEFPEIDVESMESMLTALNSTNDAKVIAAMELLGREGFVKTIPALILYHPSDAVALAAIDTFAEYDRQDFVDVARRRLDGASPYLRSALIAATSLLEPDKEQILEYCMDEDATVQVTAHVFAIQNGWGDADHLRNEVHTVLSGSREQCGLAFLRAIRFAGIDGFEEELEGMLAWRDTGVRQHAIRLMLRAKSPHFLPFLRDELGERDTRRDARRALYLWGDEGRDLLLTSLEDRQLAPRVRWHVPKSLGYFPAAEVVPRMLQNLLDEPDGMVRYRTLVALDQLQERDGPIRDKSTLYNVASDLLTYAFQLADWHVTLERFAEEEPEHVTPTHDLLRQLLADKERNTADLILRLIGLARPGEDVQALARGLRSSDSSLRSSALELIEYTVPAQARPWIMGLLSGDTPQERLAQSEPIYSPRRLSYPELLRVLVEGRSRMLRMLGARLAGEMKIRELRDSLEACREPAVADYDLVIERALESLDAPRA